MNQSIPTQPMDTRESVSIEQIISSEIKVTASQVRAAIKLLDSGATVPFIARYRKEATGGMTDTHLRMLAERLDYLRELETRRQEVLESIQSQNKLTPALKASIEAVTTKAQLEDIYLPFKPRKRTKAQIARESGLEPLAMSLLKDPTLNPNEQALSYVDVEKNVPDIAAALAGAREILMEIFSEDANVSGQMRDKYRAEGVIVCECAMDPRPTDSKFSDYFDYKEPIHKVVSHRMLAILRGRQENVLKVRLCLSLLEAEPDATGVDDEYVAMLCDRFEIARKKRAADEWLYQGATMAWKYKLRTRLEVDILMELRKLAEEEAIKVFATNLKSLLLAAPAGPKATLGLDPGYRTGIKMAVVDVTGKVVHTGVLHLSYEKIANMDLQKLSAMKAMPTKPAAAVDSSSMNNLQAMIRQASSSTIDINLVGAKMLENILRTYQVQLIAIGNGTASRETEMFTRLTLKAFPDIKAQAVVVSEAGASVYSASERASQELPSLDVSLRGAVSIARRLQDPLAELVKIEPKSIGVGQYQHDVNQSRLESMLSHVVEDCVNAVGVDINTASSALLSYVAGLNKLTAARLVEFREQNNGFQSRQQILKVPGLGEKAFEQAAGFLRVTGGENPLDASSVHPESYPVVEKILKRSGKDLKDVMGNTSLLRAMNPQDFSDEKFGLPTVTDILSELEKPGRDPRPEFRTASFMEGVYTMDDLKPGMALEGTITNVANFGAFVDIGVHQDGLVHVSELANYFVDDPKKVVKVGQIVRVKVVDIDKQRKRIALTMRTDAAATTRIKSQAPGSAGTKASAAKVSSGAFNSILDQKLSKFKK